MPSGGIWWSPADIQSRPAKVGRPKRDRKKQKRRRSGR